MPTVKETDLIDIYPDKVLMPVGHVFSETRMESSGTTNDGCKFEYVYRVIGSFKSYRGPNKYERVAELECIDVRKV